METGYQKSFVNNFRKHFEESKEKGLTQSKLGKAIGVDQTTISAWLKGESEPSASKLCLLAEFFETTPDLLMNFHVEVY